MNSELRFYFSLFLRRMPLFSAVVLVVTALALVVAVLLPPVYRAQAVLLVESPQIPGDLASPTVRTSAAEQLQIVEQRMLTRANLLETANRFRLYQGQTLDPNDIVTDMRKRTRISVDQGRDRATIVQLSFEAADGDTAAEVANAFVSFMLEENVSLRTAIASQTVDFFRREVQRLNEELEARSARILQFKLEHRDSLPENLPELRTRQAELAAQLTALADETRRIAAQRTAYVDRFERTGRVDVVVEDEFAPFLRRLAELQDELDRAVAAAGAGSQRAVGLRGRIASVERSINAQLVAEGAPTGGAQAIYDRQLGLIDDRVAEIEAERAVIEDRLAEVNALVQDALGNSITLDTLERDYLTAREQYAAAMASASAAETGDLIETMARGQRISVLEYAVVPPDPARPNRRLIAVGGVAAGIALALGLLVLLERLNQTVRRPTDLTKRLGIAPFATIPHMETPGAATLRRAGSLGVGAAILLGVPAALYAVHVFYLPLDLLVRQTISKLGLAPLIEQIRQGTLG